MHIVIIGAGKVGFALAQRLSHEDHDVVVVERDDERRRQVEEHLDVQVLPGNGCSPATLEEAGIKAADMLIAVTDVDEVNLVACVVAKHFGVARTIARVRNAEFAERVPNLFGGGVAADLMINPELVTAREIANLLKSPVAITMEEFAGGRVRLEELKVTPECRVLGKHLRQVQMPPSTLVVAIRRGERVIIPRGDDRIMPDDHVFIIGQADRIEEAERLIGSPRPKVRRVRKVMILGGSRVAAHLAMLLEKAQIQVKVVESDRDRCASLVQQLKNTLVLHGDGTDLDLLKSEGAGESDAFVALTGDDKLNVLVALLAKSLGAQRTIAQVQRSDYIPLLEHVGIDVPISPRLLTAGVILRLVRQVETVHLLEGDKAEVMEVVAPQDAAYLGIPLSRVGFPPGALVGAIAREGRVIVPGGRDAIAAGDRLVVFALPAAVARVEKFLATTARDGSFYNAL